MTQISLELPIKIKQTVEKNGFVITDANNVEHFFYQKENGLDEMEYDGISVPMKN